MQVLKEEVRQELINQGIVEFMLNGFQKASVRRICKNAGTTIGNFYNYFKSKEELFYIITTPVYESFINFISDHNNDNEEMSSISIDKKLLKDELTFILTNSLNINSIFSRNLVILIDGSKGTKFENAREEIISFLSDHFKEHLDKAPMDFNIEHEHFSHVVASSFLEGIMDILRSDFSQKETEELLIDYMSFFFLGFINMFQGE